jgi:hypothetical protein
MTKTFPEVISGIRTAKKGVEVREDIAQMGEYVEQFAATATQKAEAAAASEKKASDAVANIDQQKADSVAAVQQAQTTATTAITQTKDTALTDIDNAKTGALQEVANSTEAAETAASAAAGSASDANASEEAASAAATAAAGSASTATTKAGEASTSSQAAEKAQKAAEDAAALAGTRANTDKTLRVEDAPADAAATGAALDKKANKDSVLDPAGNAIFYSKAEVEAKIKEILAAQREEDLSRIKFWASNDPTSPASFIGGTWERIEGRFIMGASDTYPAGSTGGSATHYHDYKIKFSWNNGAVVGYHQSAISPYNYQTGSYYLSEGDNDKVGEGYTLVNTAANNASGERQCSEYATHGSTSSSDTLNPYYSMYIWRRVA